MIKIRLQRHGARHAPFYRMVVAPSQARRDGRFLEVVGTYNPQSSARERELDLKMDRIDHWLEVGAQPTDTAKSLIRQGRLSPEDWLKRTEAKASAKAARAAKKKNPAPVVEEKPVGAEPEAKEAAPAEEAPAVEEKPAEEEKAADPAPEAKEAPVEDEKAEEKPVEEAKEEPKAEAKEETES
jgi:small subunit ribosomal protein S16